MAWVVVKGCRCQFYSRLREKYGDIVRICASSTRVQHRLPTETGCEQVQINSHVAMKMASFRSVQSLSALVRPDQGLTRSRTTDWLPIKSTVAGRLAVSLLRFWLRCKAATADVRALSIWSPQADHVRPLTITDVDVVNYSVTTT